MTLIKICGVKSIEEGHYAARCGADYVGIVMHIPSIRYVEPIRARAIAKAIREIGAVPVAVFYDEPVEEILRAVETSGISTVQTYRNIKLPDLYTVIYGNPDRERMACSSSLFLFDGAVPGSGQQLRPEHLPHPLPGNFFIAGGVDSENVVSILKAFSPAGIDVSSGVESRGRKDCQKIQTFIEKVRDYDKTVR